MGSHAHEHCVVELAIPQLRDDLEVQARDQGMVDIRDPHLLRIYSISEVDYRIARYFDHEKDAEKVFKALPRELRKQVNLEWVESVAEELDELYLLDTEEAWAQEPEGTGPPPSLLRDTRRKVRSKPAADDSARWSCHACGKCCHGLVVELTEEEESRIDVELYRDIVGKDGHFAEDSFIDPDSSAKRVLKQRTDEGYACIFLQDDGLCAVHARQGMEAKPDPCQIFPYSLIHLPKGKPRISMRTSCHTMHETYLTGEASRESIPEVLRVLNTSSALAVPKKVPFFGQERNFSEVDEICLQIKAFAEEEGINPDSLDEIDHRWLNGRVADSISSFGDKLQEYVAAEKADIPIEVGSLEAHLKVFPKYSHALKMMSAGIEPEFPRDKVSQFLARQFGHALYGAGAFNLPDTGYALVALVLALHACLHGVGPKGQLRSANKAYIAFTIPVLENTSHIWPVLEAIDMDYAQKLKKEQ